MNYNNTYFSHDRTPVVFHDDTQGVTITDESVTFDWSEIERVKISDVPWADAFETTEFYKIPATVARPIKQQYYMGNDEVTFMKPREELKRAAWSLENAPWTLDHPDTGMLKDVSDIHGFWRDVRYIDSLDDLDADLHVPVNDEEAKNFLEQYSDVSVGFYNRLSRVDSYDGVVGQGDDINGVDAYQTNLYFDHVASVERGRCSGEQGCGIDNKYLNSISITDDSEDVTGQPEDPSYEEETTSDGGKNGADTSKETMTETTDCGETDGMAFLDSLSFEAVYAKNDAVQEHVDALEEQIDELETKVENKSDELSLKDDKIEELEEKVDSFETDEKEELVDEIVERTDALGTKDDLMELELDSVQDKYALVTNLVDEKTAGPDSTEEQEQTVEYNEPVHIKKGETFNEDN